MLGLSSGGYLVIVFISRHMMLKRYTKVVRLNIVLLKRFSPNISYNSRVE